MSSSKNLDTKSTSFLNKSNSEFIEQMYLKFIKNDPELPQSWQNDFSNFHYHPIIQQHADDWNGRAGWIYEVIHEDFDNLTNVDMFACGSPNMVFGTLDQLEPLGLKESNMHSDVFAYANRADFSANS